MTALNPLKSFPFYRQMDSMDCGPTCLRMIAKHYGQYFSLPYLRTKCYMGENVKGGSFLYLFEEGAGFVQREGLFLW